MSLEQNTLKHSLNEYKEAFLRLFKGREDVFAQQIDNGSYRPRKYGIRIEDIDEHLIRTVSTFGIYLLNSIDCVSLICIDIDIDNVLLNDAEVKYGINGKKYLFDIVKSEAKKQSDHLTTIGINNIIEFSGKRGYHVWVFFDKFIPASFVLKFKDKWVLPRNPLISAEEQVGELYEFFPKQASAGGGLGNLIKLPLGIHRVSKGYSYFLDSTTMERVENSFEKLIWLDTEGRVKSDYLEGLLGEKIVYPEYMDKDGIKKRVGSNHLTPSFPIEVPDQTLFEPTRLEMLTYLVKPYDDQQILINPNNPKACPPCIYKCYYNSKYLKGEFFSRIVVVRFFANIRNENGERKYTPSDIAGFIQWEINDDDDRKYPERLQYYTAYAYGDKDDPNELQGCSSLQEHGWCINFNFECVEKRKFDILLKEKETLKQERDELKKNVEEMTELQNNANKYPELYFINVTDWDRIVFQLKNENKQLRDSLQDHQRKIRANYLIKCERIWHPSSSNNHLDDMIERYNLERIDQEDQLKYQNDNELIDQLDLGIVEKDIPNKEIEKKKLNPIEKPFVNTIVEPCNPIPNIETIKINKELQIHVSSDFKEINEISKKIIQKITHDTTNMINELQKTTRVGMTTSLTLASKLAKLRILLLEPTNLIGLDTFAKTVLISTQQYQENLIETPIYGAVFGSNINMCLKIYQLVKEILATQYQVDPKMLAISKDLPFVFKKTCVKHCKDGTIEICPHYNHIYIGYPRKEDTNTITPLVESRLIKLEKKAWCKAHHHVVDPNELCSHEPTDPNELKPMCKKCSHFQAKHDVINKAKRPICAYATIYRHLMEDTINVRVHRGEYIDYSQKTSEFRNNGSDNLIFIPKSEIMTLIEEHFINPNSNYLDFGNVIQQGLLQENGELKDDVKTIQDVKLRIYDTMALTYNKIVALYQSVNNTDQLGTASTMSEGIIDVIKKKMNGIICDEVSHLVAQSPLKLLLYGIPKAIDENAQLSDASSLDFFQRIDDIEIRELTRLHPNKIEYFNSIISYMKSLFLNTKNIIFNPNDLAEMFSDDPQKPLSYEEIMKIVSTMKGNLIPIQLKERIKQLQDSNMLELLIGGINAGKREPYFLDVYNIRLRMKRIASKIHEYLANINDTTIPAKSIDLDIEDDDALKNMLSTSKKMDFIINSSELYKRYLTEYMELMIKLKTNDKFELIKDYNIVIINELLFPFNDKINDLDGTSIGEFTKNDCFKPKTYIILNWCKINTRLFGDWWVYEGHQMASEDDTEKKKGYDDKTSDEIFIELYNMLIDVAIQENVGFPHLVQLLLLMNAPSFFILSLSTSDFKTQIIMQTIPSFDDIVELVQSILKKSNNTSNLHNFAVTTDATMPLIEMTSIFNLPTRIWKIGDPKKTCEKQLVITDSRTVTSKSFNNASIKLKKLDYSRKNQIQSNINDYYIKETDSGLYYIRISNHLMRFRLFVFINTLVEKYSAKNLFIISQNKNIDEFLTMAMRQGGNGIPLHALFIEWLQTNYSKEFDEYFNKGWIRIDKLKTTSLERPFYSFHLSEVGNIGLNQDNGERQYYRGSKTIGTESKCRIMLAIGAPTSPINSYEWLSQFYIEKNYKEEQLSRIGRLSSFQLSQALRRNELQCSAFQTFSRVKDPLSKQRSIVFAWGINNSEYQWTKCSCCDINEFALYNQNAESEMDDVLNIRKDEIYYCSYQKQGKSLYGDLCYNCIIKNNAKILGIADQTINNMCKEPKGVQDFMAFKIPTPHIYSIYPNNTHTMKHFFDVEKQMLSIANLYLNEKSLPNPELIRFRDYLITKIYDIIQEKQIDISKIPNNELTQQFKIPLSQLRYWITEIRNDKPTRLQMNYEYLKEELLKYGLNNLTNINVVGENKGELFFSLQDFSIILERIQRSEKKKSLYKTLEINDSDTNTEEIIVDIEEEPDE